MAINLLSGMRMPGIISGYGGGTFDLDGTQVTPGPVSDFPMPSMPRENVMAETVRPQAPQQSGASQQPQRRRPNFLEVVGRVGDVMALMGGRDPLFERFQAQEQAAQEEAMQKQAMQNFMANPNDQGAFQNLISVGFDPRDAVALRTSLAPQNQGPEPIKLGRADRLVVADGKGGFTEVVAPAEAAQGTLPRELLIEQRMREQFGDEVGDLYLRSLTPGGKPLTEYERRMLDIRERQVGVAEQRVNQAPAASAGVSGKAAQVAADTSAAVASGQDFIAEMRALGAQARRQGILPDSGATPGQRATAIAMENIPLLERVVAGENAQTREQINSLVTQNLPRMISIMSGLSTGGRNFDAAKELEFWTKAFGGARTYPAFVATLDRLERKINTMAQAPRPAPAAPARRAPQGRNTAPPRRREGAPTTARRVNGRLVFE